MPQWNKSKYIQSIYKDQRYFCNDFLIFRKHVQKFWEQSLTAKTSLLPRLILMIGMCQTATPESLRPTANDTLRTNRNTAKIMGLGSITSAFASSDSVWTLTHLFKGFLLQGFERIFLCCSYSKYKKCDFYFFNVDWKCQFTDLSYLYIRFTRTAFSFLAVAQLSYLNVNEIYVSHQYQ